MRKIILLYGGIAGLVVIATNTLNMELGNGQEWLGFLVMFIAFSSIFVAIRQYRDQQLGGVITFSAALLMGLGISLAASLIYVLVWEIYLAANDYTFIDRYIEGLVEAGRAAGKTDAELATLLKDTQQIRAQYNNPLIRVPITFLEIFPVGLIVAFATAAMLKNQSAPKQSNQEINP